MDCYLGFDFGTTSIKATAMDGAGRRLASIRVPCKAVSPEPGWFEVDAADMWRGGLVKALRDLGPELVGRARSICVSSVCATFVPVGEDLEPKYNAILYGIDTRASEQVERLNAHCAKESVERVAGTAFTSHSVIPKLLWFKERMPSVYAESRLFLESTNFVTAFLTGKTAWDGPSAAGAHMVDQERVEYPLALLSELGLDAAKLPRLANPLDVLGRVSARSSAITGLPEGATVLVGAGDVNAEAFAGAAVDPGELTLVYGSTISTLFVLDSFKSIPGFLTGPSVLGGTYRVGGATSSGGRFLDWARALIGLSGIPEVESTAEPSGLLMVPYLDGARTPSQSPKARVAWYGMDSSTTRGDLWKACMESMGYELSRVLERFAEAAPLPSRVHAMGGLSSNRDFLEIVANITGMPQLHYPEVDASYGDALMALSAERGMTAVRAVWDEREAALRGGEGGELVLPNAQAFDRYSAFKERYASLDKAVLGLARQ